MTPTPPAAAVLDAYRSALLEAAETAPSLAVVETGLGPETVSSPLARRFPSRYATAPVPDLVPLAVERCEAGGPVFVGAPVPVLLDESYPSIVRELLAPRRNVKLVGFEASADARRRPPATSRDDLPAMRAVPGLTVVAPADGPTTRGATLALAGREGPAYLRLPPGDAPSVTDGTFAVGRAHEVRAGSDLTIVSLGRLLARSLEAAEELARVGVSVRVLDVASVKPFDEAAILRAARDTGAILVVEDAPVAGGLGTLVAAMTAENLPVPVRRLGRPDLWPGGQDAAEEPALSLDRVRDEAWELLRLKGRIA